MLFRPEYIIIENTNWKNITKYPLKDRRFWGGAYKFPIIDLFLDTGISCSASWEINPGPAWNPSDHQSNIVLRALRGPLIRPPSHASFWDSLCDFFPDLYYNCCSSKWLFIIFDFKNIRVWLFSEKHPWNLLIVPSRQSEVGLNCLRLYQKWDWIV